MGAPVGHMAIAVNVRARRSEESHHALPHTPHHRNDDEQKQREGDPLFLYAAPFCVWKWRISALLDLKVRAAPRQYMSRWCLCGVWRVALWWSDAP